MKTLIALFAATLVSACGVETASTAATAASIKKQELQEGQRTMQRANEKIDGAMQQLHQRAASSQE